MKIIKLASAITALSLLSGCSFISGLANEIVPEIEIEQPTEPKTNKMPSITEVAEELYETEWYSLFCESTVEGNTKTIVPGKIKGREVEKAFPQLYNDCPKVFWLNNVYYTGTATDGTEIGTNIIESLDEEEIPEMRKKQEKALDKALDAIPSGLSDYEKVIFVHDYLIENTKYDYKGAESDTTGLYHHAYGCLVNQKAVCSGYARAFQMIMQELDIESGICTGSNHAWNYVKIDGDYYWIDLTWDDYDFGGPVHTYCMITTDQLMNTRTFDRQQGFVPDCTATEYNYIVQNGGFFEIYDKDAVLDYINENSDEEHCEIMFGSFEAYSEALNSLIAKSALYKADGVKDKDVSYYRTDELFVLDIVLN